MIGAFLRFICPVLLYNQYLAYASLASTMTAYDTTKYIHTPMHEVLQTELYLAVNAYQEIIVSYAGRGRLLGFMNE